MSREAGGARGNALEGKVAAWHEGFGLNGGRLSEICCQQQRKEDDTIVHKLKPTETLSSTS